MGTIEIRMFIKGMMEEQNIDTIGMAEYCDCHKNTVYSYLSGDRNMPLWFAVKALEMMGYHFSVMEDRHIV